MNPLEYRELNGNKILINLHDISYIRTKNDYSLIVMKTGDRLKVKEHISEINTDIVYALKDEALG